jgi:DNA-binding transcriptional MocR family regulator
MKKYQRLAQQIISQIEIGVWQPGDKLPSLREQVSSSGMSFMTVGHAYQMLESQGRIVARPQSGYYVSARPVGQQPTPPAQVMRDEAVDINTYIFDVLQASRDPSVVPFASAFPDPRLFPLQQLNRSLANVSKTATAMSVIENLPPGNSDLRHAIARRYAQQVKQIALVDPRKAFFHMVAAVLQHKGRRDDGSRIQRDVFSHFCQQTGEHIAPQ